MRLLQKIKVWWAIQNNKHLQQKLKDAKAIVTDGCVKVQMGDGLELFFHNTTKDGVEIPVRKVDNAVIYPYDGWGRSFMEDK